MDIDTLIARHGVALPSIRTSHPHDPPFTYTVGRQDAGRPELIVFGLAPPVAASLLNELAPRRDLVAGRELEVAALAGQRVRLVGARPQWARRYALAAYARARTPLAGRPRLDLAVSQVVWADANGRLPGEAGRPATCACCPDLSRPDRPFAEPFDGVICHGLPFDGEPRTRPDEVAVCLPVRTDRGDAGRGELVRCRRESDHVVRLLQPPMLADWTTAGALLALDPEPDPTGAPLVTDEVQPSPRVHLTWAWDLRSLDEGDWYRVQDDLEAIAAEPDVELSLDGRWLAVAATPQRSERIRARMRRLVRDGLATEAQPFSAPPVFDPDCERCRTGRHGQPRPGRR